MKAKEAGALPNAAAYVRAAPGGVSDPPPQRADPGGWRVPSGPALGDFALRAGFLAGLWLRSRIEPLAGSADATHAAREKDRWIAGF